MPRNSLALSQWIVRIFPQQGHSACTPTSASQCSFGKTACAIANPAVKALGFTERNSKRDRLADIPFHRLWRPEDAGELTFVGLRVVAQQNLLVASNGTENLVLAITPEQRRHLAQHQRSISLTISAAVTIHTRVQGMER